LKEPAYLGRWKNIELMLSVIGKTGKDGFAQRLSRNGLKK
jgi:hypothetical protein